MKNEGKEKKVIPAIVFVTKHNSREYVDYKVKALSGLSEYNALPDNDYFEKCKYYYDKDAGRLVLVLKSEKTPKSPLSLKSLEKREETEKELDGVERSVTELIKTICKEKEKDLKEVNLRFSGKGEVVFLRHFGDGGSRDNIYKQELILQKWAKGRDNFKNWDFFLISSVRPEMFDLTTCEIPTGDGLKDFVKKLKNGVFNVRTLQDIQSAELLKRWRDVGWETKAKAVFCIVTEFAGPDGSKVKDFLGRLPDDEKFNASLVPLFIVTQNGVRYSNWDGWSRETSFVQVLQNFKQANGNLDRVYVCQLFRDALLNGFGQIACDEFNGYTDFCYKSFFLDSVLSGDVDDRASEKTKMKLKDTVNEREKRLTEVVRFLTGKDGLPAGGAAGEEGVNTSYQQVMRELGH